VPKFRVFKKVLDGGKGAMKGECVSEQTIIVNALYCLIRPCVCLKL